ERELREWLCPPPPDEGAEPGPPRRLGPALEAHAEEVEERDGVAVRVVAVGQAARRALPADDAEGLCALVLAAREAMANAAAHAEVASVDVFAELEAGAVTAYVRDRGPGFDLAAVPADRQGLRGSIVGRVERAGGSATITTEPGRGTEVRISIPHDAGGAREP
ncbi:ATP-binding protein, partial [Euzebya sp.]|uniref:ATP-binding protein n=1 Tax=Euzebya sp. TaxID=1971409 RepID=UPI0035151C47